MSILEKLQNKLRARTLQAKAQQAKAKSDIDIGRDVLNLISASDDRQFLTYREAKCAFLAAEAAFKDLGIEPPASVQAGIKGEFGGNRVAVEILESIVAGLAAAMEARQPKAAPAKPAPSSSTKPASTTKPATPPASARSTLPQATKPAITPAVGAPAPTKPDMSKLTGAEKVMASMRHGEEMKAWAAAEAERLVSAEEAASQPTRPDLPATAENIAAEILRQQAEAAKPKSHVWSTEAASRRQKIETIATDLIKKHS